MATTAKPSADATVSTNNTVGVPVKSPYSQRVHKSPAPDPNEPVISQIKFYLDRYKIKEAAQIFYNESNLQLLKTDSDFMWELIPSICKRLRGLCQFRFRVFEGCENMLYRIASNEHCNPKEVLINLLAELNKDNKDSDDNVFKATIRPLEATLMRMDYPSPRVEHLSWVLNVLTKYIDGIELPQEYNYEGDDRVMVTFDPQVKRFNELIPLLLSFIEDFDNYSRPMLELMKSPMPILTESQIDAVLNGEQEIVEHASNINCDNAHNNNCSEILVSALITLVNRPTVFLDCTTNCKDFRNVSRRLIRILLRLKPELFSTIYKWQCSKVSLDNQASQKQQSSSTTPHSLAIATIAYLYRRESDLRASETQYFPQVLTHECSLISHLPFIMTLLEGVEVLVHEKGLLLLESLLKPIRKESLGQRFLDSLQDYAIYYQLIRIMVFSPLGSNRRSALTLFTKICDCLINECRFKFLKFIIQQEDIRANVRAFCIDLYRKYLSGITNIENFELLGGVEFIDICVECCLKDLKHTDIIENDDLTLATMSLLRFLKLRNLVRQEMVSKLKKAFFEPIKSAVKSVTNELNQHKHLIKSNGGKKRKNADNKSSSKAASLQQQFLLSQGLQESEVDILTSVLGSKFNEVLDSKNLVKLAYKDEEDCLNWALCRTDLIECVFLQTCELYDT